MKKAKIKKIGRLVGKLLAIATLGLIYLIVGVYSCFLTCVIYAVVVLVAGFEFSWLLGTGIWALWFVPYVIFTHLDFHKKGG